MDKRRDLDAAERMDALVSKTLDLEEKILDWTAEKLDRVDPRDLPNAFKSLAIGSGVLQDKSDRIKGKPLGVVEHRWSIDQPNAAMEELLAGVPEPVDAEIVEE